jgi:Flp pilus assembly protein TadD
MPRSISPAGKYAFLLPPLLALAVYAPAASFGLVLLDDPVYVIDNPHVLSGLSRENLRWAFSHTHETYWHPLVWLSLMLDAEVSASPGWFHAVNIILHAASALLLYLALARMSGLRAPALAAAALFAVHPLNVEAVAWVTERKTVLAAAFWMAALYLYAHYAARPGVLRYLAVLAAMVLGLLAKPVLVTLPFVLLLLDFWPLERLSFSPGGGRGRGALGGLGPGAAVAEKLPLFLAAAGSVFMTLISHPMQTTAGEIPVSLRAANAVVSYLRYLVKAVRPEELAVFYPFPDSVPAWQVWGSCLLLVAVTIAAVMLYRRAPYFIAGWLWYLGVMTPTLGLVRHDRWPALADRFAYLPLAGLFMAAGFALFGRGRSAGQLKAGVAAVAVAVLALGVCARVQLGYWSDSEALFNRTLAVTENNWLAHMNLGSHLYNRGETGEAVRHFRRALEIRPGYGAPMVGLGLWRLDVNDYEGAEEYLRRALDSDAAGPAWQGLAKLGFERGDYAKALVRFHKAVRENPRLLDSWKGMAVSMRRLGLTDQAAKTYVEAARRHLHTYRLSEAAELAGAALALEPSNDRAAELRDRAIERLAELGG